MDEYGFEIQKDNIDGENTDSLKDLEQSDEDADNYNNTSDNQANDVNVTQENTEYSETESIHNMEADINERDDTHLKNKLRAKKHKSKEMKKPMQIFTVLEEEISDVSDIETPRT